MAGAAIDIGSSQCEILRHHNELSIVLNRNITTNQLKQLKGCFLGRPFGEGDIDSIEDFLDLWKELNKSAVIQDQVYIQLENALETIQAYCHLDVINEFKEKMKREGEQYIGEVTHNKRTLTKTKLLQLKDKFQPLMMEEGPDFGTVHVYENAVIGLIQRSGGELGLRNGTARLQIPSDAIADKDQEIFWIFRPSADTDEDDRSHLVLCRQEGQSLEDLDDVVKYSLPVALGPPGVTFQSPVLLTLKEYSFPDSANCSGYLSVYRRTGENGNWGRVGSCFPDRENRSAIVPLNKFSSYVLGMPATSELLPLNVHIMIQRLPKKENDTSQPCDMQVVFSMNDHTYIQEMVLRKRMNIVCETSYYLDPKSDVNIRWENRNVDGSVYSKQTAVLQKGRLNRLAEKMQNVTIPIQDEQQLVEDRDILVILEQHDTDLVELLCRDDRPMKKEETTPKVSKEKKINGMNSHIKEKHIKEKQSNIEKKVEELELVKRDCDQALKTTADRLAQVRREDDEKYAALNKQYISVRHQKKNKQYISVCHQKKRVEEENRTNLKALRKSEDKVTQPEAEVEKLRSYKTNVQDITAQKCKAEKELEKNMKQENDKVVAENMMVVADKNNVVKENMVLKEKDAELKKLREQVVSKEKKINFLIKETQLITLGLKNKIEEVELGKKRERDSDHRLAQVRREDDEKYDALNEQYITVCDQKQRVSGENRTYLKALRKSEDKVTQLKAEVEKLRSYTTNVQDITAQKCKVEKELEKMKQEKVKVVAEKMKVVAEKNDVVKENMVLKEKDAELKKLREQVAKDKKRHHLSDCSHSQGTTSSHSETEYGEPSKKQPRSQGLVSPSLSPGFDLKIWND